MKGGMGGEDGEGPGGRTRQRVASLWSQAGVAAGCEGPGGFAEMVQSREACTDYQLHSLLGQSAVGLRPQQAGSVEVAKSDCLGSQSLSQTWM